MLCEVIVAVKAHCSTLTTSGLSPNRTENFGLGASLHGPWAAGVATTRGF